MLQVVSFVLCVFACAFVGRVDGYDRAIFYFHGLTGCSNQFTGIDAVVKAALPSAFTYASSELCDGLDVFSLNQQAMLVSTELMYVIAQHNLSGLDFTFVGYSQGGILARELVEGVDWPARSVAVITMATPHMGLYGDRPLSLLLSALNLPAFLSPGLVTMHTAYQLFQGPLWSLLTPAQLWNDPSHSGNTNYIPWLNNQYNTNPPFKQRFANLRRLVVCGSPQDGLVEPWQSTVFGYYDGSGVMQNMTQTGVFLGDTVGLKSLYEAGKVVVVQLANVDHNAWTDPNLFKANILQYLM